MKFNFITALLLSASSAAEVIETQMDQSDVKSPESGEPDDQGLSGLISSALAGAKPGIINEARHRANDKEGDKQVTKGRSKNYKFHWKYACAFTKWIPSNQFLNSGKDYNAKTMTLERFGFIGMDKKCFWGMVGVEWITPLKVNQIKPGKGTRKPRPEKPKPKPKPKPRKPKPHKHTRPIGSRTLTEA